jgi:hypothetical protein
MKKRSRMIHRMIIRLLSSCPTVLSYNLLIFLQSQLQRTHERYAAPDDSSIAPVAARRGFAGFDLSDVNGLFFAGFSSRDIDR